MIKGKAMAKIAMDLKEFFAVRNLDEAEVYFAALPTVPHFRLVDKLTSSAVEQRKQTFSSLRTSLAVLFRRDWSRAPQLRKV